MDGIREEFFDNLRLGPILVCTPQIPFNQQLKAIANNGFFPLMYIKKENLDRNYPGFDSAINSTPNMTGIIISIYYTQLYF